jgi:hypothetical protein
MFGNILAHRNSHQETGDLRLVGFLREKGLDLDGQKGVGRPFQSFLSFDAFHGTSLLGPGLSVKCHVLGPYVSMIITALEKGWRRKASLDGLKHMRNLIDTQSPPQYTYVTKNEFLPKMISRSEEWLTWPVRAVSLGGGGLKGHFLPDIFSILTNLC